MGLCVSNPVPEPTEHSLPRRPAQQPRVERKVGRTCACGPRCPVPLIMCPACPRVLRPRGECAVQSLMAHAKHLAREDCARHERSETPSRARVARTASASSVSGATRWSSTARSRRSNTSSRAIEPFAVSRRRTTREGCFRMRRARPRASFSASGRCRRNGARRVGETAAAATRRSGPSASRWARRARGGDCRGEETSGARRAVRCYATARERSRRVGCASGCGIPRAPPGAVVVASRGAARRRKPGGHHRVRRG